jgi:hypothetical protein
MILLKEWVFLNNPIDSSEIETFWLEFNYFIKSCFQE